MRAFAIALAVCLLVSGAVGVGHFELQQPAPTSPSPTHLAKVGHEPALVSRAAWTVHKKQYGVAVGDVLPFLSQSALDQRLNRIAADGVSWIRLDLSWADVQPGGPNLWHWSDFDRVVAAAKARHLRILPTLAYTPPWARPRGCRSEKCAPASTSAFATFVRAAATRYAPAGIATWEIWNEENNPGYWAPTPNAHAYAKLLRSAVRAIRSVEPHAFIISGGLEATLTVDGAISPTSFLATLGALGVTHDINAVGYHPYTYPYLPSFRASWGGTAWNKIASTTPSLVGVLRRYGTPNLPIWLTEYGAPTAGPGQGSDGNLHDITQATDHVTLARQRQIASNAVETVARSSRLGALFWYSDQDLGGSGSSEDAFGLRYADGRPKPALSAFRHALASTP
jgi:polysaccharide biosynthesis protein PslG